ncbi:3D domain-containing protein [Brunnivagina elsteri]|uniref:3D domain-containing protein n=1 Tax=Brunnivagina elsteri TaxID=1247191 RepID=UPI001FE67AF3|nr:3D domain-containing protein [Calothrix elsteri]
MPPGALAIIRAPFPFISKNKINQTQINQTQVNPTKIEQRLVSRYVLDQDTGGAIKSPGRVDY